MEDNPYGKMLDIMSESAAEMIPVSYRIGTVVKSDPLAVDVAGTIQKDLVIADYPQPVTVFLSGKHSHRNPDGDDPPEKRCEYCSTELSAAHTHSAHTQPPSYSAGEKLLLLPIEEEQRYIVIARLLGL